MDEKLFTQEELDKIIAERIGRERKKFEQQAADQPAGESENEEIDYKTKLEELRAERAELENQIVTSKKQNALVLAGYSLEQSTKYHQFLTGSTDEEIAASIEKLKSDVPPKGHSQGADVSYHGKPKSIWNPWR